MKVSIPQLAKNAVNKAKSPFPEVYGGLASGTQFVIF